MLTRFLFSLQCSNFQSSETDNLFHHLLLRSLVLNTLVSQQMFALAEKRSLGSGGTASSSRVCRMSFHEPLQRSISDSSALCLEKYGDVPAVHVHGDVHRTLVGVPSHVYFVLLELLKNALKATAEKHRLADLSSTPVTVHVASTV